MGPVSRSLALLGAVALPLALGLTLPLQSSNRWILDATGARVKFRCANWAGHLETNLPEGLNKQPLDTIAGWLQANDFNCVRLTYSIDMALAPDVDVQTSFANAAAPAGIPPDTMATAYQEAVQLNPFLATATRLDVFGAVVDALWSRGIMTVLDNHVSRASWCCNYTDGNGWWADASGYDAANQQYFITANWLAGLQAMASWAQASHPGVVAMSLRNEMRQLPVINSESDWYSHIQEAGALVHQSNPDVLVVVGGVYGAMDLSMVGNSRMLDTSGWPGKHVWEFHAYSYSALFPIVSDWCWTVQDEYGALDGFVLEQGNDYTAPLFLSEFGVGMTGGADDGLDSQDSTYLGCLVAYMTNNDAEWAVWALQGSYYVREGTVDYDETYGLLTHDWSQWRNPDFPGMLGAMWNVTQGP